MPQINHDLLKVCRDAFGLDALMVGPGVKTGLVRCPFLRVGFLAGFSLRFGQIASLDQVPNLLRLFI